ncbi:MAG: hydrogenase maturation nickel metallochaperone HypA [Acidobacteriota bacterium]
MHEYSIVRALIDRVEREAAAHRATAVRRVEVRVGELAGVESGLLATAYETFRERTICAGAELVIRPVAARWSCPRCSAEPAAGAMLRCPACAVPLRLAAGDELVLERIEMEVA